MGRVGREAFVGALNRLVHRERIHSSLASSEFRLPELLPGGTPISRRVPDGASV